MRLHTTIRSRRHRRGAIFMELAFALSTLSLIMAALMISLHQFARFNHRQLTQQRCSAAALAQLDSITATGAPLDADTTAQLWPDVTCTITTAEGAGRWRGLTRVEVTATAPSHNATVTLRQQRYVHHTINGF